MRNTFAKVILELAERDPRIVVLTGDIMFSSLHAFKAERKTRFFDFGLREQTMVSAAGGMASQGLLPVVCSITPFILERAFEQIKIDIDDSCFHVIMMGYDDYPTYGPTHTPLNVPGTVSLFKNVRGYYPQNNHETEKATFDAYLRPEPAFLWLRKDGLPYVPRAGAVV